VDECRPLIAGPSSLAGLTAPFGEVAGRDGGGGIPLDAQLRLTEMFTRSAAASGPCVALAWKHWRHFVWVRRHRTHMSGKAFPQ